MPTVSWLCEYPTLLGGERSLLAVADVLRSGGFEVNCIAPPEGSLAEVLRCRQINHVPIVFRHCDCRRPLDALRSELRLLLDDRRPDLLHANSLSMGRLAGPVAADLKLPSIAHLRDIIRLSRRAVGDLNCNRRLLAVSQATRTFHIAQGVDAEKTHVAYNGVDLSQFRPRPKIGLLHRELGLPHDAVLIGAVGQIVQRKGWLTFAEAARHIALHQPQVHFVIVGARFSQKPEAVHYERRLRALAFQPPLMGRWHWLGTRGDVDQILNELSLLVHTARQEPLGRVLLEAAATGLPIVATNVGGTAEIFPPDTGSAWLVPPDDPHETAHAVLTLLRTPEHRLAMGQAARHRAETAFDARHAGRMLLQHYRDTLAASGC